MSQSVQDKTKKSKENEVQMRQEFKNELIAIKPEFGAYADTLYGEAYKTIQMLRDNPPNDTDYKQMRVPLRVCKLFLVQFPLNSAQSQQATTVYRSRPDIPMKNINNAKQFVFRLSSTFLCTNGTWEFDTASCNCVFMGLYSNEYYLFLVNKHCVSPYSAKLAGKTLFLSKIQIREQISAKDEYYADDTKINECVLEIKWLSKNNDRPNWNGEQKVDESKGGKPEGGKPEGGVNKDGAADDSYSGDDDADKDFADDLDPSYHEEYTHKIMYPPMSEADRYDVDIAMLCVDSRDVNISKQVKERLDKLIRSIQMQNKKENENQNEKKKNKNIISQSSNVLKIDYGEDIPLNTWCILVGQKMHGIHTRRVHVTVTEILDKRPRSECTVDTAGTGGFSGGGLFISDGNGVKLVGIVRGDGTPRAKCGKTKCLLFESGMIEFLNNPLKNGVSIEIPVVISQEKRDLKLMIECYKRGLEKLLSVLGIEDVDKIRWMDYRDFAEQNLFSPAASPEPVNECEILWLQTD